MIVDKLRQAHTLLSEDKGLPPDLKPFMRLVCDSTVGKLARILRMAGFDTAYVAKDDVGQVLSLSREQERVIVSRNSRFIGMVLAERFCYLTADDPYDQFRSLVVTLGLQIEESLFLSRCVNCNEPLVEVDKEQVRSRLYDFVARTQERIYSCPRCDKLYWHATHARAMTDRLLAIKVELVSEKERRSHEPDT